MFYRKQMGVWALVIQVILSFMAMWATLDCIFLEPIIIVHVS